MAEENPGAVAFLRERGRGAAAGRAAPVEFGCADQIDMADHYEVCFRQYK